MVMLSSTLRGRVLKFHSEALDPNTLLVVRLTGSEAISAPYEYQIELISQRADLDSQTLLENRCSLGIKQGIWISGGKRGIQTIHIHGVLERFEQLEKEADWVAYRAVMVPRFSRLALSVRSAIYMDQTVPEIVQGVLEAAGFTTDDFQFLTQAREYPKREYVVQYRESDLQFISRLLEHEGIFYFFLHGDEREKVIFADSADNYPPSLGDGSLAYRPVEAGGAPTAEGDWFDEERATVFAYRHTIAPKEVVLKDYNYRTPSVDLKISAEVNAAGVGTVYEYGDHYKDTDEGNVLARIRAEEHRCRERTFHGTSDCRSLRAGATFTLQSHYREEFNAAYVVTRVVHRAEQSLPLGTSPLVQVRFHNEFDCIPSTVVFRPKRVTPKPRAPGAMNARIDASGDGTYAEIDDQGRYRVQFPFDLSGRGNGKASRPVRMAQPYAGPGYGVHFTLHKGTEVVVTHVEDDPDRPIVSAAIPNPETESPVKDVNQTQSMLKSAANNAILFEDQADAERLLIRAQRNQEIRVENDVYERVANDRHLTVGNDRVEKVERDHHEKLGRDHVQEIEGNRSLTVNGNEAVDIGGKSSLTVEGDVARAFMGNHSQEVSGDSYVKANQLVLEATSGITLTCGGNSVVIDPTGVTVTGALVVIDGGQTSINSGAGSSAAAGSAISAATPVAASAPVEPGDLEKAASSVCEGGETAAEGATEEKSWITIVLKDDDGNPVPREMYEITCADGTVVRGRLDKDGKATVKGISAGSNQVTFPRIDKGGWQKG